MTLAFYMDQHVPAAISRGLQARGIDVLTAQDDGTGDWSDERLLQRATELDRVTFTQDDDFLAIGRKWQLASIEFAGIVYSHQQAITIGQAIVDLDLIANVLEPEEIRNCIEFIPI